MFEDIYSLSPTQLGILFHYMEDSNLYFEQMTLHVKGDLDIELIQRSLNGIISRHQSLRTAFLYEGYEKPIQVTLKDRAIDFKFIDATTESKRETINKQQELDRNKPFDIMKDVLMRMTIIKTHKDQYVMIWSHHHIIMDGWCLGIIFNEFREIYRQLKRSGHFELKPVPQYVEYIKWLEKRNSNSSETYWKNYLKNFNRVTSPPKRYFPDEKSSKQFLELQLQQDLSANLKSIAKRQGVTVSTLFQVAWGLLLMKYNDTDDVVFGTVVSGRPTEIHGVERIVGLFINTIPVRIQLKNNESVGDLLVKFQSSMFESEQHHHMSLPDIQALSEPGRGLFNNVLVFENYPITWNSKDESNNRADTIFEITEVETFERTSNDFYITVIPGDQINIRIDYDTQLYDPKITSNIPEHLSHILSQMVLSLDTPANKIQLLSNREQSRITENHEPLTEVSEENSVIELFEKQVLQNPDAILASDGEQEVTYGQINERSNQLARYLAEKYNVSAGDRVGLMLDRSVDFVIAVLGILKAGGCYVPIDTEYPKGRKDYLLNNSEVKVLVTDSVSMFTIGETYERDIIALDIQWEQISSYLSGNLRPVYSKEDLAYIIYTSGSTGTPKGVMISHESLLNYITWAKEQYVGNDRNIVMPFYSSPAFDLTITSIFVPLISGNQIRIYGSKDKHLIEKIIQDNYCNLIKLTPSHLKIIQGSKALNASNVKAFIVGGEELHSSLAEEITKAAKGKIAIYNEYGPTEATVGCMIYTYNQSEPYVTVPIGKAIPNMEVYVLDSSLVPVADGVVGELYISGSGLAKGYFSRTDLTDEKFINHPFKVNSKLYKTGDLAIRMPDKNLVFMGRSDKQVKIRGYRIELGEIESNLTSHPQIKEAVVLAEGRQEDKKLVAHYVANTTLEPAELKNFLIQNLPEYMIPFTFIHSSSFPLTSNGKIDKKKLIEMATVTEEVYVAPTNATEEILVEIWSEVLEKEKESIGIDHNFFDLGGHSLKGILLIGKVQKQLNFEISITDFFARPTIRLLAEYIESFERRKTFSAIPKTKQKDYYELSSAQKRLYFLYEFERTSVAYNMPQVTLLSGVLDTDKVENAINQIIAAHEIFRTTFKVIEGEPVQHISDHIDFKMEYFTSRRKESNSIIRKFIRPFNLLNGPLIRAAIVQIDKSEHLLLIDMHHIISDGLSWNIFLRDFVACYKGCSLTTGHLQFKDYAEWQKSESNQSNLSEQNNSGSMNSATTSHS